jgi:hypothetical protein
MTKRVADMTEEERDAKRSYHREYQRKWRVANPGSAAHSGRKYRAAHPDKVRASNAAWGAANPGYYVAAAYRRRYGLTPNDYDRLLAEQGHRCAICGAPVAPGKRLHVDHDHETSKVRGLLCHHCNTSLGGFRDSPAYLANAINYLERNQSV